MKGKTSEEERMTKGEDRSIAFFAWAQRLFLRTTYVKPLSHPRKKVRERKSEEHHYMK